MKTDMNLIFDIILTGLGLITVGAAIVMKRTGRVSSLLLAEEERAKLKDTEGYIGYIAPRLTSFALVCTLIGVLGILDDQKLLVIPYWGFVEMTLFLIAFLLFCRWLREARAKYLGG